ncbi:MAG: Pr6Pr family membrane protein [Crocinitomicaceae bacterium]
MKKKLALSLVFIAWFAVIAQYVLMVQNRHVSIAEVSIRFLSFFTILTNIVVAIYFTCILLIKNLDTKLIGKAGTRTAIAIYITMVGSVYQLALRHVWQPEGLQRIVDELLHSVIPILVIIFWAVYERTKTIKYFEMLKWSIFPLIYLGYILIRGDFSNFYPYPFVDVTEIGLTKVFINSTVLLAIFFLISGIFILIGKSVIKR